MDRRRASEVRQQLLRTEEVRRAQLDVLLRSEAMVEGSFVTVGRKCGKPTCRCVTGEKHFSKYLSRSEGGKTRLIYVPGRDEVDIAGKAERYRRLREARAELMKLASETANLADALQEALTEPYPASKPASGSSATGRTRKGETGDGG